MKLSKHIATTLSLPPPPPPQTYLVITTVISIESRAGSAGGTVVVVPRQVGHASKPTVLVFSHRPTRPVTEIVRVCIFLEVVVSAVPACCIARSTSRVLVGMQIAGHGASGVGVLARGRRVLLQHIHGAAAKLGDHSYVPCRVVRA